MASLDPMGLIGRIYIGDHYAKLHTKYIGSGPHGFREEDSLSFSHYKSMGANDHWGVVSLGPRGLIGSRAWENRISFSPRPKFRNRDQLETAKSQKKSVPYWPSTKEIFSDSVRYLG